VALKLIIWNFPFFYPNKSKLIALAVKYQVWLVIADPE